MQDIMPSDDELEGQSDLELFDPELCAKLYNEIIEIGFEGSKLAENGDHTKTKWFEALRTIRNWKNAETYS
ncbi:hypothetical protein BDW74DRAFT_157042 [Aspergillus multicolor]|uniref:uncharacterized protein n=1 Tax=Aspergillus multicolor TaxID=41759 RepID=UPI003CCD750B